MKALISSLPDFTSTPSTPMSDIAPKELIGNVNFTSLLGDFQGAEAPLEPSSPKPLDSLGNGPAESESAFLAPNPEVTPPATLASSTGNVLPPGGTALPTDPQDGRASSGQPTEVELASVSALALPGIQDSEATFSELDKGEPDLPSSADQPLAALPTLTAQTSAYTQTDLGNILAAQDDSPMNVPTQVTAQSGLVDDRVVKSSQRAQLPPSEVGPASSIKVSQTEDRAPADILANAPVQTKLVTALADQSPAALSSVPRIADTILGPVQAAQRLAANETLAKRGASKPAQQEPMLVGKGTTESNMLSTAQPGVDQVEGSEVRQNPPNAPLANSSGAT
ncbi:MAG: hypothetical protein AAGI28_10415, partial [Pseudomonadota bacterium]